MGTGPRFGVAGEPENRQAYAYGGDRGSRDRADLWMTHIKY